MSLNKLESRIAIPAATREYTPGSCRNSRKPMICPPHREMRPYSPALGAEKFLASNETHKEPRFAFRNSRESPGTPSHI